MKNNSSLDILNKTQNFEPYYFPNLPYLYIFVARKFQKL